MLNNIMKNKWVYGLILLLLIALAAVIFFSGRNNDAGTEIQVNQQTSATQSEVSTSQGESEIGASEETENGYYMVREDEGVVKVFWCVQDQETVYRETEIAFSLLSMEDQQLLTEGVKLSTEQELFSFLENFDS